MDILLSLPIASYFFTTSLTSWSTSLNLLFFYMTWSTLVLSHSPLKIEIIGTTAIRLLLWLIPSLLFLAFDTLIPSLAETIKYNGASALPPRDPRSLAKLLTLALVNLALETVVEAGISLALATYLKTPVFRTSTTLPLPWQMIKQLFLLFTGREILSFYIHRHLLHGKPAPASVQRAKETAATTAKKLNAKLPKSIRSKQPTKPRIGRRLQRLHATYAHARGPGSPPFSLLLKTDHPLPYLAHHFVPLYLPALILHLWTTTSSTSTIMTSLGLSNSNGSGLHLLTYLLFLALATVEETLSHSGYTAVPGILMGGITRRTALHFSKAEGSGNFGSWGFLDWVHGTSLGKNVWDDVHDEADKHQLRERGEEGINGAVGAVRDGIRNRGKSRRTRAAANE